VDEWNRYHDRIRESGEQWVLYPDLEQGFGAFVQGIAASLNNPFCDLRIGVEMDFDVDVAGRRVRSAMAGKERIEADRWYWCAHVPLLGALFQVPMPDGVPQFFSLGSFTFEKEVDVPWHEILVADPAHRINRISFPGKIAGRPDVQVQVEYAFPRDAFPDDEQEFRRSWEQSFRDLRILTNGNSVRGLDYRYFPRGFVTAESYGSVLKRFQEALRVEGTNLFYPFLGVGREIITRVIPSVYRTVMTSVFEELP